VRESVAQPFILLALLLQLASPALAPYRALAAQPAVTADCREWLEQDDGLREFLRDRAALREKFQTLESITAYPAEMHAKFDADVKLLLDPEEALAAKLLLIRHATESVDIAHFILITDGAGKLVVNELKDAILRGVNVRILVDSYGSRASIMGVVSDLKALLSAAQGPGTKGTVEVVVFNPQMSLSVTVKKWFTKLKNLFKKDGEKLPSAQNSWNNHLHDKIVAADLRLSDRAVAIVGGRGIEEIYYAFPEYGPKTFRDLEMVVRNPRAPPGPFNLGSVLGTYFDTLYYHLGNKFLSLGFREFLGRAARKRLQAIEEEASAHLSEKSKLPERIERLASVNFLEADFESASLQFVHESENALRTGVFRDDLYHDRFTTENPGSITMSLRMRLAQAKDSVDIVTPYAWFPEEEVKAMQEWVDADPKRQIRIITNSVATGDSPLAQSLVDAEVGPAFMNNPTWKNSRNQIQVLAYGRLDDVRYGGPTWFGRLHAKYFIFDRKFVLITSFNADPRSRYWSTESGFYVYASPNIVAKLVADADNLASMSTVWGSKEWVAVRSHIANQRKLKIQNLLGRIMKALGLTPLV
jgi:putative cardiolipin synthase